MSKGDGMEQDCCGPKQHRLRGRPRGEERGPGGGHRSCRRKSPWQEMGGVWVVKTVPICDPDESTHLSHHHTRLTYLIGGTNKLEPNECSDGDTENRCLGLPVPF